jgi:hypothetical protein
VLTVLENLGKLGLGGLFGGAVAHILLMFFQFEYADGTIVNSQDIMLIGAFLGASLGRLVDRMLFVPLETSRRRRLLIEDIRRQRLPVQIRNELIKQVYSEDISSR